jgi:hypothetical protein
LLLLAVLMLLAFLLLMAVFLLLESLLILASNVNDIETKRKRTFDLGKFFISKRNEPCLFQNL